MSRNVCGIICEYNPFHLGHKWQLEKLKNDFGFDAAVCVMSGNFVQRGEPSIISKEKRAECAIQNGADLVLELPFPYSCFGAEKFAEAGVKILDSCGFVGALAFGSECADAQKLLSTAKLCLDEDFKNQTLKILAEDKSLGFARARSVALKKALGFDIVSSSESPNDILAVEYLKAIIKRNSKMAPLPIKRNKIDHHGTQSEGFASASYIRELLKRGELQKAAEYVPKESAEIFCDAVLPNDELLGYALIAKVLPKTLEELSQIAELRGNESALYKAVTSVCESSSPSYLKIAEALRSKHLTDSKIRRMLLFALTETTIADMSRPIAYTRVIAANDVGQKLLKSAKVSAENGKSGENFAVISGASHLKNADEIAKRQFKRNAMAEKLFKPALKKL